MRFKKNKIVMGVTLALSFSQNNAFAQFDPVIQLNELNGTNGFRIDGESLADRSGFSVSTAGDFNGDGVDDLIIGAYQADPGGTDSGSSYVIFGTNVGVGSSFSLSSLDGSNGFRLDGATKGERSGLAVSDVGDVNGDGIGDIIIGAPRANPNMSYSGSSYVVFGSDVLFDATLGLSSLDGSNGFRLDGETLGDLSGSAVSAAGDINGDGIDDIVIGAYNADLNGAFSGSSYVVFGSSGFNATLNLSTLDGSNGFRLDGMAFESSGGAVSSAGDVNGDGIDDLIIGAQYADNNGSSSGSTYLVFGTKTEFSATLDLSTLDGVNGFRIDGTSARDLLGRSISRAGDVNDDGIDDIIIGAPRADYSGVDSGSTYVVFGSNAGFDATFNVESLNGINGFRIDGTTADERSGTAVNKAGDVNGDGIDDIIIGAPLADVNDDDSGSSYLVFGRSTAFEASLNLSSLNGSNGFRLDDSGVGNFSGFAVSSAGDFNGDGMSDVIIGAYNANNSVGSSYVVYGKTDVIFMDSFE